MIPRFALIFVLAIFACPWFVQADEPHPKTNVLFIVVDDLNTWLGCYGDSLAKTPNIDRLARRSVRFERAYCQSPLCNPSRTSMLSGRYPTSTRVLDNDTPSRSGLGNDVAFLPEHFKQHGYFTAKAGKVAHEEFANCVQWTWSDADVGSENEDEPKGERSKKARQARARERNMPEAVAWRALDIRDSETPDGRISRSAAELLEEHHTSPFFIAVGFHKPHRPYEAPARYFADFPSDSMPLPQEPADVRKNVPPVAFDTYDDDTQMPETYKRHAIAAYRACIAFIDAQVGILLDTVDRLKLWDNTVIVLTSDHGYLLGEHGGMWRKMSLFEEASRVPLLIAAPGGKGGETCLRTVELVDLYPTLTELCALSVPSGLEGVSISPLLTNPAGPWNRPALTFTRHSLGKHEHVLGRSVRTEQWRYTEWGKNAKSGAELYDHEADPKEWVNLATQPEAAGKIQELKKLLMPDAN